VPPTSGASVPASRLQLSRQNSLRGGGGAQGTVVGARLALGRVSSLVAGSRSPGSPPGSAAKTLDLSVAAPSSCKTEDSDATSTQRDDDVDDDDDVRCCRRHADVFTALTLSVWRQEGHPACKN